MKSTKLILLGLVSILALSGCARYKARPLNRVDSSSFVLPHSQSKFISLNYRIFNRADCRKYLDRNVISYGYQPVHITITNNTNRYLNISMTNFSLPFANSQEVAQKVHTSTVGRVVSYGIATFFFPPFFIAAIVDGISSFEANRQLDADFAQKTLQDQILSPYSKVSGLIFVPRRDFEKEFTFIITDRDNCDRFELGSNNSKVQI